MAASGNYDTFLQNAVTDINSKIAVLLLNCVIKYILKSALAVNRHFITFLTFNSCILIQLITFLRTCRLKIFNSLHSCPTCSPWLVHHQLLILQYNTYSILSLPVAVDVGLLVLKKENLAVLYFKCAELHR